MRKKPRFGMSGQIEIFALDLFSLATPQTIHLFIVPPTASVLQKLVQLPRFSAIIQLFPIHHDSYWGDNRPWIAPYLPIELSSADYFANRDPVLETVLALIEQR